MQDIGILEVSTLEHTCHTNPLGLDVTRITGLGVMKITDISGWKSFLNTLFRLKRAQGLGRYTDRHNAYSQEHMEPTARCGAFDNRGCFIFL